MLSEDVSLPVKSRIHAFEALASKPIAVNASANKSAPSLLDAPVSPSSKSYFPINPSTPSSSTKSESRSPSPSGPRLGRKTSLIDDWVLEDGPLPYAPRQRRPTVTKPPVNGLSRHVSDTMVRQSTANSPPLSSTSRRLLLIARRLRRHYRRGKRHTALSNRFPSPIPLPHPSPAARTRLPHRFPSPLFPNAKNRTRLPLIMRILPCRNWVSTFHREGTAQDMCLRHPYHLFTLYRSLQMEERIS